MTSTRVSTVIRSVSTDTSLLESFVGYDLRRAAAKQRERLRAIFGPHNIRPAQLAVLILIHTNSPLKQSELGKVLQMRRANVVTLLDELQQRGLIDRRRAERDRRAHELHLTAAGRQFTDKLLNLHSQLEHDLAKSLGEDTLQALVALLQTFRTVDSRPDLN